MYKFKLYLMQEKVFEKEEKCFENLIRAITDVQRAGFVLVKIKENKYYLKKKKGEEKITIEVIKEKKSK